MESITNMLLSEETRMVLSFAQIGGLIGVVWAYAKMYFSNKAEIQDIKETVLTHENKIVTHEEKHNKTDIETAIIKTKLDSIEVGIVDIKTMLTTHISKD